MADAIVFFRTDATQQPQTVSSLPDDQKLTFTLPDDLLESVSLLYENNIKDAPVSNPSGVRKVNKQDNGLQQLSLTFRGRFRERNGVLRGKCRPGGFGGTTLHSHSRFSCWDRSVEVGVQTAAQDGFATYRRYIVHSG